MPPVPARLLCPAAFLVLACLVAGGNEPASPTELLPGARVEQFKLPMYGESGYKIWDVEGSALAVLGEGQLRIDDLVLQTYSGDERISLLHTITSQRALVFPEVGLAKGAETLQIEGDAFSVSGRDWTWNGGRKTITVGEEARVVFHEPLGDILR